MSGHPVYDRLRAEGLDPPATGMLVGERRELTAKEWTFAEALERALTENADVWQALADRDAGTEAQA